MTSMPGCSLIRKCCSCGRVEVDGRWVQMVLHPNQRVSHGFCGPCGAVYRAGIEKQLAQEQGNGVCDDSPRKGAQR